MRVIFCRKKVGLFNLASMGIRTNGPWFAMIGK